MLLEVGKLSNKTAQTALLAFYYYNVWCLQCAPAGFSSMTSAHVGQKRLHLPLAGERGATATLGPPHTAQHFVHRPGRLPTGLVLF